jgi:hypothetical protein
VTSRLRPPALLPSGSLTIRELPETRRADASSVSADDKLERNVLELAALGRRVIDAPAITRMSGIEDRLARGALSRLTDAGLLKRVGRESYQLREVVRSSVLSDLARAQAVRTGAIEALRRHGSDPERLLELLVDAGRVGEAVQVYWHGLGNFSRLHPQGRDHFGARLCRRLNGGSGPEEVSPALRASDGAWAVMNDWSQFALCCGDAVTCAPAAAAAHDLLTPDSPPWDAALLAAHAAQGFAMAGRLADAMQWCERSWDQAREGTRRNGGFAVREVMDAYDWSANTAAKIYLRLSEPSEIRRLIDDLFSIHEHARQSIAEFNAGSIIPLPGPSGELTAEQLVDGRLAAMLALAEGEFTKVESLAAADVGAAAQNELGVLRLRAELAAGRQGGADALLPRLRRSTEAEDDSAAECELAVLAQTRIGGAAERLAEAEAYLPRSAACGLGMHWRDLQLARARALRDLGRRDEACAAAESALLGNRDMAGAHPSGDWAVAREAASLLASLGRPAPADLLATLQGAAPPPRRSPARPVKRRPPPSSEHGATGRAEIHAAAVRVLQAYETDGTPFALHFRKFDIEVLHGPFELGPKLTENALRDALPPEVELITIQDQSSLTYDLGSSRLRREAPALLLEDERWADVVRELIPHADLIVSEALMLSPGVRDELQMIYDAQRWDRTVLVLPPPEGSLATIDNDGIVQMFPRCVWADSLHEVSFVASPVITDLLERLRGMAQLPAEARRALRNPRARDEAFPIDLGHVAEYLESQAQLGSVFGGDDARTRYYAFWQMFRAAAIRALDYQRGDRSVTTRCRLAHSYLEMSKLMLDHSTQGDKFILQGDPAEAQLLVRSAYGLLRDIKDDLWAEALRAQAEHQDEELLRVEQVMKDNPDRFEIRARYGPLTKRKVEPKDT